MIGERIITIDLTQGRVGETEFTEQMARMTLGGFGFNVDVLQHNLPPDADALGPENILIISRGLLTGTAAPSSSRIHLNALSPLSGLMGSSNIGGFLGVRMREMGLVGLIITGRAEEPVYIHITESGPEIRPAGHLWGRDTRETDAKLREEAAPGKAETLVIGPAGERLGRFACLMSGPDHAAGRTGMGAVMGSKNLKGLVLVSPGGKVKTDPAIKAAARKYVQELKNNASRYNDYSRYGSSGDILWANESGVLGTHNYRYGSLDGAEEIDGRGLGRFVTKKTSCHRCPVHCKAEVELEGRHAGFTGGRPEYETIIDLGALCGLNDPNELIYLSNLCNILGLDTISTGSVIAFAMDLFDRGIIDETDTNGLKLEWGDARAMEELIRAMARRRGIGDILAEGVARAAERIGQGADKYAYHVKGVEIYGADPRGMMATALAYAVSLRGGDFTSVYPVPEFRYSPERALEEFGTEEAVDFQALKGKGAMVKKCMAVSSVVDSLGLCKVPALSIAGDFNLELAAELLEAVTGLGLGRSELLDIGLRIVNLERLFNTTRGGDRRRDTLPGLFATEIKTGPAKGGKVNLEPMVDEFYAAMGWDDKGRLTPETVADHRLDLSALDLETGEA